MPDQPKKSSWPYWLAACVILLPVFYVLSLGPIVWLQSREMFPQALMESLVIYVTPFEWAYMTAPAWLQGLLVGYVNIWRK